MSKITNLVKKGTREILRYIPGKKAVNTPVLYGELLKGRTVLITGGGSGIGYAIAESCCRNGANVIITGRNLQKLNNSIEKLQQFGTKTWGFVLDVCDVDNINSSLQKIIERIDVTVDTLINNAGVLNKTNFGNTTEKDYDSVIDTDLKGTYFLTQAFASYLKKNKIQGNILNISSSSSIRPATTSYHLAKWGVRGLTKGLAKELSPYGIVVNGLAPGPTATEMLLDGDDNINRPVSPIGRYATAEEIANLAVILISDLSRMVVGDTLFATGGCGTLTYDDWD